MHARHLETDVSRPHLGGGEHGGILGAGVGATTRGMRGRSVAVLEAPTVVAGLDDVAVVREAIEQCRRHLGIGEDTSPFSECQIGRHDQRRALVEAADQME